MRSNSKQDLHGLLTHVYNRMIYYGEQRLTLYSINHCSDSIDSYSYHSKQEQDQHDQKKELEQCNHTNANKEDQEYCDINSDDHAATQVEDVSEDIYDDDKYVLRKQINSNSDDGNENDDDTFHDAIQVEDVMDDTDEERDDYGEPRLDHEGKKIVVIGPSPNEVVSRVFLTKPDERGNMKQARVVELIDQFDDALDKDPL